MASFQEGTFARYTRGSDSTSPRSDSKRDSKSVVSSLSTSIVETYSRCNPNYAYDPRASRPVKILTKPSEPSILGGHDNVNDDLIVAVNDIFISPLGIQYTVQEMLGQGTFGQVFKCISTEDHQRSVAVKVIKNQAAYYHQARVEIGILQFLNTRADPHDKSNIVRLTDFFLHKNHLCLVFELLHLNLFELIKYNKFRGLSLALVRVFLQHILEALAVLKSSSIIHCDIKPENILLASAESGHVKLIDFGSACFSNRTVYSYIQSRFYRSPEVILGYPYTMAVDMWSLGCVAAELFLGLPLFPAACEHDLLGRISDTIGTVPPHLLAQGKNSYKFFRTESDTRGTQQQYILRTAEEFTSITGQAAPKGKQYFRHTKLADIVNAYPLRPGMSDAEIQRERKNRESFTDFLLGLLEIDPAARWTPRQAQQHPFIAGTTFRGPFQPVADLTATMPHHQHSNMVGRSPSSQSSSSTTMHAINEERSTSAATSTAPGMPMSIPKPRNSTAIPATSTARISSSSSTMATSASGGGMASSGSGNAYTWNNALSAAAMLATSPHVHAQAHAAAMAAMQSPLRLQQQQQMASSLSSSSYVPEGSLQRIIGQYMPHQEGIYSSTPTTNNHYSTSSSSWQNAPLSSSLPPPLFTPPSRSFGLHLEQHLLASYVPPSPSYDTVSDGRILPLLQLPTQSTTMGGMHIQQQHQQWSSSSSLNTSGSGGNITSTNTTTMDDSASSFKPYSLKTFHSMLIETAANKNSSSNSGSNQQQQQYRQHPAAAATAATTNTTTIPQQTSPSQRIKNKPLLPTTTTTTTAPSLSSSDSSTAAHHHTTTTTSPLASSSILHMPIGESSETSIDGSTPQKERLSSCSIQQEDDPNPADWDPLWSDDLLKEDDELANVNNNGGGGGGATTMNNTLRQGTTQHNNSSIISNSSMDEQVEDLIVAMQHLPQLNQLRRSIDDHEYDGSRMRNGNGGNGGGGGGGNSSGTAAAAAAVTSTSSCVQ